MTTEQAAMKMREACAQECENEAKALISSPASFAYAKAHLLNLVAQAIRNLDIEDILK